MELDAMWLMRVFGILLSLSTLVSGAVIVWAIWVYRSKPRDTPKDPPVLHRYPDSSTWLDRLPKRK